MDSWRATPCIDLGYLGNRNRAAGSSEWRSSGRARPRSGQAGGGRARIPNFTCIETVTRVYYQPGGKRPRACPVLLEERKRRTKDLAGQSDVTQPEVEHRLTLGAALHPGEYVLQVVVTDKLAPKGCATISQSTDFEIRL